MTQGPAVPLQRPFQDEDQRVDYAKLIKHKGLELKSDWLTSPPTVDPHFLSKLETEKRKGFLVTRVKVDPFHWLKRYSEKALWKSHILFSLFMGCMRDAVFHLHQPDAEAYKVHLVATGRTTKVL
jgi:hypothetical protein